MNQSFINVVVPFEARNASAVNAVLRGLTDPALGNRPTGALDSALRHTGVHFMSMTVVEPVCPSERDGKGPPLAAARAEAHLVIEISADDGTEETLTVLARRLEKPLLNLLATAGLAVEQDQGALRAYLMRHAHPISASWGSDALGQVFSGSPGMSVERTRAEAILARHIGGLIEQAQQQRYWNECSPRQLLEMVRSRIWDEGVWKWAFVPQPAPCLAGDPHNKWQEKRSIANPQLRKAGYTILHELLWPLYLPFALIVCTVLSLAPRHDASVASALWSTQAIAGLLGGLVAGLAAILGAAAGRLRVVLAWLAAIAVAVVAYGLQYHESIARAALTAELFLGLLGGVALVLALVLAAASGWLRALLVSLAGAALLLGIVLHYAAIYERVRYLYGNLWQTACDLGIALLRSPHTFVWTLAVLLAALAALTPVLWRRLGLIGVAGLVLAWWYVDVLAALMWGVYLVLGLVAGFVLAVAAFLVLALRRLQRLEQSDAVEDQTPRPDHVRQLMEVENHCVQNHLASVSRLKPGLLRRLTLRLAFMVVGTGRFVSAPGFLGKNGVIHFARWMRLPGTDQLLFWSNYDGTWESYVADFIADAPTGVTAIWSNCIGFPRTRALFARGAEDRDRLVRWARRQQQPTTFWYSAYADLTAERIRINAAIRQGLASAESDADCRDWLALFGSKPAPASALRLSEIPTLALGGLSRMPFAECHAIRFSADLRSCKEWLAVALEAATYGETPPGQKSAVVVAFAASGLAKLGISPEALATFPVPFQEGMWHPWRARALGDDTEANDPRTWEWGNGNNPADALLLVYGVTPFDQEAAEGALLRAATKLGHTVTHSLALTPLFSAPAREPFGFADGISQPVIRGTPNARAHVAASDLVAAGEILLGYPDNLGEFPPSPSIAVESDPNHLLPDVGPDPLRRRPEFSRYEGSGRRDLGANGTFLVARQLRQDVQRFRRWIEAVAEAFDKAGAVLADHRRLALTGGGDGQPYPSNFSVLKSNAASIERKWLEDAIAAKLVGRWWDGTSLVRHPLAPGTQKISPSRPDNDFLLGADDPSGLACPFGAHIRRANPRDTRFPGEQEEVDSVNRHRILRVGRTYGKLDPNDPKKVALDPDDPEKGLLFMCLNADIERQFEFIQKTWLLNRNLHGLEQEVDPIIGQGPRAFTIPTATRPLRLEIADDFVTLRGGGYFFLPGRSLLRYLAN